MHRARSLLVRWSEGLLAGRRLDKGWRRPRLRVPLDGHPAGYALVAVLAASLAFAAADQTQEKRGAREDAKRRGRPQQDQQAHAPSNAAAPAPATPTTPSSALAATAPPYSPSTYSLVPFQWPSSSSAPSVNLLTSLSPSEVAAHPLLQSVGRFGLPQLPLVPLAGGDSHGGEGAFHLSPPLLLKRSFLSAYNTKTRTADWTLERLTRSDSHSAASSSSSSSSSSSRNSCSFHADAHVAAAFQSHASDYRGSGFDRGHLVPAADVSRTVGGSDGAFDAQSALCETFALSNVSPQVSKLNRGFWLQLENHVRTLSNTHETFVLTGPLWIPSTTPPTARKNNVAEEASDHVGAAPFYLHTGVLSSADSSSSSSSSSSSASTSFVHVPTHFFKVVLLAPGVGSSSAPLLGAFIVPNAEVAVSTPLSDFAVPLEQVELYAGWHFFPRLQRPTPLAASDTKKTRARFLQRDSNSSAGASSIPSADLCASGACDLKIKEFHFHQQRATK